MPQRPVLAFWFMLFLWWDTTAFRVSPLYSARQGAVTNSRPPTLEPPTINPTSHARPQPTG